MHHRPSTPTTLHQHQGHQNHHINTTKFIPKPKTTTQNFQNQPQQYHCHNQQPLPKIIPNPTTKPPHPQPTTTGQNHHHRNSPHSARPNSKKPIQFQLPKPNKKNQSNSNCQNQIRKTNPPFSMAITVHAKPGSNPIDAQCCCLRERKYRVLSGLTSSSGLARGGGNE